MNFKKRFKKKDKLSEEELTIITVDQFNKYLGTVQQRGWYPIGSNPTIEVSNSREKVTVLGAVTEDGDSFHCWTEETLTADHGVRFLDALTDEFGEDIVVMLDRASYFYAKDIWDFVSGKEETEYIDDTSVERVCGESLQVWYFPSRLPELNPTESYWQRLNDWFKFKLIDDMDELKNNLLTALDEIEEPEIFQYICP